MPAMRTIAVACLLGLPLLFACRSTEPAAKGEAVRLTREIPLQSSPSEVINYLVKNGIEHSEYLSNRSSGGSIQAVIRDRSKLEIVHADYGVTFKFDGSNHLTAIQISEHLTGP